MKKRGKHPGELKKVIGKLVTREKLEKKYNDHELTGNWKGHRDCHIQPDWILIYRIEADTLFLERMGTHSDLSKK